MKRKHPDVEKQKQVDENQKENDNKNESLDMEEEMKAKTEEVGKKSKRKSLNCPICARARVLITL
ncbi:hypothetical protein SADUNF_Sadunf10G0048900 [Salix dunnii]|uniref:Uncharacterized protein n=1 Tax=Salix dunnii TaxID=1413687 RepID=A0A835JQD3_9ROSI|nr:hypothetical protein SADUNF_Sadunf10G0048900 [Salix dunnii]